MLHTCNIENVGVALGRGYMHLSELVKLKFMAGHSVDTVVT